MSSMEQAARDMSLGKEQVQKGAYEEAIVHFDAVLERFPLFAPGYIDRGAALHLLHRNKAALFDLSLAVALLAPGPEQSRARHNRARVREALGDLAGAEADFANASEAGLAISREALQAFRERHTQPIVLSLEDAREQSRRLCEQARKVAQTEPLLALAVFHQASELDPSNALAFHGLGTTESLLERPAEALAALGQAIELGEAFPAMVAECHFYRATLLSKTHREPAIAELQLCLQWCRTHAPGKAVVTERAAAILLEQLLLS